MNKQPRLYTKSSDSWTSITPYNANPGLCIIINNMIFTQPGPSNLPGGKMDENSLNVVFTILGFDVKIHQNLTSQEITTCIESYSQMEHNGVFFLIILSHGCLVNNLPAVIGTDGEEVIIADLESCFYSTNCPSLAGVPKIFLIDACRGSQEEKIYRGGRRNRQSKSNEESGELLSDNSANYDESIGIADAADFMIIYASTHGKVAYASENKGSQLTQSFASVLAEAPEDKTFLEITLEVQQRVKASGVAQVVEVINRMDKQYFIKRNTDMSKLQKLHKRFRADVTQWVPVRNITIQQILEKAEKLKIDHRNVNISRITGASTSIGGSLLAIAGFGLAPFTLGGSLVISTVGIGLAVAGGATAAGASITDIVIEKSNIKEVQEQIDRDYAELKIIQEVAEKINNIISTTKVKCPQVSKTSYGVLITEVMGQGAFRISNIGLKLTDLAVTGTLEIGATALRVGGATAKGIAAAGIVMNIVLIPIDIAEIVRSSFSLSKGSETNAVKKLREVAAQLEEQKKTIKQQAEIQ